ncbi:Uncharacterized protein APZ42_030287 [Daphnia magna]|uniref:Uncharacterized protein n=1 Tax=Daphnia magna TaxID=35525 RepID=A0A164NW14_9CRUS|nr:Uncharacterized protein APZ42_030287 [Daphnia magna]
MINITSDVTSGVFVTFTCLVFQRIFHQIIMGLHLSCYWLSAECRLCSILNILLVTTLKYATF